MSILSDRVEFVVRVLGSVAETVSFQKLGQTLLHAKNETLSLLKAKIVKKSLVLAQEAGESGVNGKSARRLAEAAKGADFANASEDFSEPKELYATANKFLYQRL